MSDSERESTRRLSPDVIEEIICRVEHADAGQAPIVDCRSALERLDGDVELFQDLLDFFFNDSPGLLAAVETSVAEDNAENLHRSAHRLKGLLSNFDALPAVEAARRLETMGREGDLADARSICGQLAREVQEVTALLRQFRPADEA